MRVFFVLFIFIFSTNITILSGQYSVDFEGSGETKTAYASGNVTLSGISWNLTEVLIGTSANDFKNDSRSARLRGFSTSVMTMNADKPDGIGTISFDHRRYGTDSQISYIVEYSVNGGSYILIGSFTPTANVGVFSGTVNVSGNIKIRIAASGGNTSTDRRANIDDIVITDYIPAPVEFSKFIANAFEKSSFISFSTASETNNDYFTIERSGDGRSFDAIGEIKGAGNSTEEKHYEFTDENPLPGINYYRIKQTDFDGQYSYSEIRSVRHTGKGNVAISPRNTDGRLDISTDMESYDVAVYSIAGQEVARFNALAGHQTVNIEALQAGIYFVKVMSGTESETVRVVKY